MQAINTIPRDEYIQMLFEACRRMSKKLQRLADEEESKSRTADNNGDEAKALRHEFDARALRLAIYALTKSPEQLK